MVKRVVAVFVAGTSLGMLGGVVGPLVSTSAHAACPASSWQPDPPAGWHTESRTISDGQTTSGSSTLTSPADAQFSTYDKGRGVSGPNIPANATIASVQSATSVTLSAKATGSGSGLSVTIAGKAWQNPSAAQATSPDGATVVYSHRAFDPANPSFGSGWLGVSSSSAAAAGVDGYAEINFGTAQYPAGYLVVGGESPVGSGAVLVANNSGLPTQWVTPC